MRILIANRSELAVGGAEEYLRRIAPMLIERRHEISFVYEATWSGAKMVLPPAQTWVADRGDLRSILDDVRNWKPDVVYCNGLDRPANEHELARLAPSVYSLHAYFGMCISGLKSHAFPGPQVCEKRFGPGCLAHYLPRRCGGLSPLSMINAFRLERDRLATLRTYSAIVVHSEYMKAAAAAHQLAATLVPLPVVSPRSDGNGRRLVENEERQILFIGRLSERKGVEIGIDAVATAAKNFPGVTLTIAGDGNDRGALERHARAILPAASNLSVRFVGQVDETTRDALLRKSHALLVPSIWPEPFGMVGLEAAAFGVPAVAFRVGGIPEWVRDGVSGTLAEAPSSDALAGALVRCLREPAAHARLAIGAANVYREYAAKDTIAALETALSAAISKRSG